MEEEDRQGRRDASKTTPNVLTVWCSYPALQRCTPGPFPEYLEGRETSKREHRDVLSASPGERLRISEEWPGAPATESSSQQDPCWKDHGQYLDRSQGTKRFKNANALNPIHE